MKLDVFSFTCLGKPLSPAARAGITLAATTLRTRALLSAKVHGKMFYLSSFAETSCCSCSLVTLDSPLYTSSQRGSIQCIRQGTPSQERAAILDPDGPTLYAATRVTLSHHASDQAVCPIRCPISRRVALDDTPYFSFRAAKELIFLTTHQRSLVNTALKSRRPHLSPSGDLSTGDSRSPNYESPPVPIKVPRFDWRLSGMELSACAKENNITRAKHYC